MFLISHFRIYLLETKYLNYNWQRTQSNPQQLVDQIIQKQPSQMDHHHYQQMQQHYANSNEWNQDGQQQIYATNEYEPHQHNQHHHQPTQQQSNQLYYSDTLSLGGVSNVNQQHHLVQQHRQSQMLMMPPPQKSPHVTSPLNYVGQSPHTYGENGTTDDDSDDSGLHRNNSLKRPSPEPLGGDKLIAASNIKQLKTSSPSTAPVKKPKVQRKKKKKDPLEPQKPVSAYALFFRDTQAAIKGQNPNASFGEVSTIVASMWDVLEPEHKDVYKKKTEAAKIVYLKTLAAYRASVISKGSDVESSPPPMHASPPLLLHQQQPTTMTPQQPIQSPQPTTNAISAAATIPQMSQHQVLPMQSQTNQYLHHQQHHQVHPTYPLQQQYVASYKSPEYNSHSVSMQPNIQAQQQLQQMGIQQHQTSHLNYSTYDQHQPPQHNLNGMVSNIDNNGYNHHNIQIASHHGGEIPADHQNSNQQQQQHHHLQNQLQHPIHSQQQTNSVAASGINGSPPNVYTPGPNIQKCIRYGCTNQAIQSADWEDEYCSNECVINHCGDVFGNWIQKNGQQQQSFSAVK